MRRIIIYRERKKEERERKCEENRMSQSDLRIRELSCRYVRMKNKNRKDIGYLGPGGKKLSMPPKTEIDELLFAVRTSSPSEARVNRLHRQKYLLYSMKEKKGQRVGGSGCSSRKGLSLKETLFQPFLLRLPLRQEWIRLLSCPPLERIVNVSSYFCEYFFSNILEYFFI